VCAACKCVLVETKRYRIDHWPATTYITLPESKLPDNNEALVIYEDALTITSGDRSFMNNYVVYL